MKQEFFGKMSTGEDLSLITLENKKGMSAVLTDMGACLVRLNVPDKDGITRDVVLGFPDAEGYEKNACCYGATIGRSGNRIGNAEFTLNGKKYTLVKNNGEANLHSNPDGFYYRKWNFETEEGDDAESVTFFLYSPDGDQGYPGNMDVEVTYTLTNENELFIQYYGLSDEDTIMNMTNHSYFNLNGHDSGDILNHRVRIDADYITLTDPGLVPTGELLDVTGTPFDFREEKTIGQDIDEDFEELTYGHGYDHNFVVNGGKRVEDAQFIASCTGDKSGITMEVYTDLPGVQVFTANTSDYENGKDGMHYRPRAAICFETQYAPNAINIPSFEQPVLKKDKEDISLTVYRFTT